MIDKETVKEVLSSCAVPEERRDNAMATLSIEGIDFAGILELPRFNSVLPICAD